MKKTSNYGIGLAIGREAVGYAVVEKSGELARFKGKAMWGISWTGAAEQTILHKTPAFDDSIRDLQKLFSDQLSKLDPDFLFRVRSGEAAGTEFDGFQALMGQAFDKKTYLKSCPTIYHLRKQLLSCKKRVDLRLIYLALHHMLKHGGCPDDGLALYHKHKTDLTLLKCLYRKYAPMQYYRMFRAEAEGLKNYVNYIRRPPLCTKTELYRTIFVDLEKYMDNAAVSSCFSDLGKGTFLPRAQDAALYQPSDAEEAACILKRQSAYYSFLSEYEVPVSALLWKRRLVWEFACMKTNASHAARLVKEIIKIRQMKPDAIFLTYAGKNDATDVYKDILLRTLESVGGCTVDYLPTDILMDIKRTCALYDSRGVNDYFYAQDAFLAAVAGVKRCPCDLYAADAPSRRRDIGGENLSASCQENAYCCACYVRRAFGFCQFFESGFPAGCFAYDQRDPKRPETIKSESAWEEKRSSGCRIRYDGREYGVSPSGALFSVTQLILSQKSLSVLAKLKNGQAVCGEDYLTLYDELSDKAGRFHSFGRIESFQIVCREAFLSLALEDKMRFLFDWIEEMRVEHLLGKSVKELDRSGIEIIDRSVTGLFEKRRKL